VISTEDNWEMIDVSSLFIDELLQKFRDERKKDFTPESLQVYERRFKQALDLFLQYTRDPKNWKYKGQASTTRKSKIEKPHNYKFAEADGEQNASQIISSVSMVDYPYPLRENCIARIRLPIDLKSSDIDRLVAFLRTLVIETIQT
jgi:hypothetical protein